MAQCFAPFTMKDREGTFPCGKCPACTARRVSHWSFRLRQEAKQSMTAHFITLTYATEHVPITPRGFMSVSKSDLQNFFKRLRKLYPPGHKLKYYAVAEYGGRTLRPHYHIIMFNSDPANITRAWTLDKVPIGQIHFGEVNEASCGYTLKYIHKAKKIPLHANDDRVPEFSLMSKKLGANYMTKQMIKWHKKGKRMFIQIEDGKKISMPRYYRDKIWSKIEKQVIGLDIQKEADERRRKAEQDPMYYTNVLESQKAAIRKQQQKSTKNDKL